MTDTPPTDAELDHWEKWQRRQTVMKPERDPFLRLIAEVRRLRGKQDVLDDIHDSCMP